MFSLQKGTHLSTRYRYYTLNGTHLASKAFIPHSKSRALYIITFLINACTLFTPETQPLTEMRDIPGRKTQNLSHQLCLNCQDYGSVYLISHSHFDSIILLFAPLQLFTTEKKAGDYLVVHKTRPLNAKGLSWRTATNYVGVESSCYFCRENIFTKSHTAVFHLSLFCIDNQCSCCALNSLLPAVHASTFEFLFPSRQF